MVSDTGGAWHPAYATISLDDCLSHSKVWTANDTSQWQYTWQYYDVSVVDCPPIFQPMPLPLSLYSATMTELQLAGCYCSCQQKMHLHPFHARSTPSGIRCAFDQEVDMGHIHFGFKGIEPVFFERSWLLYQGLTLAKQFHTGTVWCRSQCLHKLNQIASLSNQLQNRFWFQAPRNQQVQRCQCMVNSVFSALHHVHITINQAPTFPFAIGFANPSSSSHCPMQQGDHRLEIHTLNQPQNPRKPHPITPIASRTFAAE